MASGAEERAIGRLREIDTGIWTLSGDPIRFFGFPYEIRSTIIDLGGGSLLVHSPVQLDAGAEVAASLGRIQYVVSPNKLHHLFLREWADAFPQASLYAPPGLRAKRADLTFHAELGDLPEAEWAVVLEQRVVRGSFFMEEVVFFHRASRTLILGDLIENHDPSRLGPWHRALARANAMLAPRGSTPLNYRASFWRRAQARKAVSEVLAWKPRRVVVMHGPCVERDAEQFLRRAFGWLFRS